VLLRAGRLVFIALAGPTGATTRPEHARVQDLTTATTVEVHVVPRGELRTLTRLLRPTGPRAVGPGWRGPGAAGPDESPRRRPPRATRRTSETPRSPTRPGGTMRRTDIIVDPRAPGSRRRGQLRPIGPIIERFIAQASVRSEAAEKPQRRRAA
jgi:hypothetical protein